MISSLYIVIDINFNLIEFVFKDKIEKKYKH